MSHLHIPDGVLPLPWIIRRSCGYSGNSLALCVLGETPGPRKNSPENCNTVGRHDAGHEPSHTSPSLSRESLQSWLA